MTLRKKQWVMLFVTVAGLILALIQAGFGLTLLGVALILGAGILNLVWMRCPQCGVWFGKYPGEYCQNCGAKIPWNEKKKRIL